MRNSGFERLYIGFLLCLIILFSVTDLFGGTVQLSWYPPVTNADGSPINDLGGYRIYYGTTSRDYSNYIDVGNVTTYQISNLTDGRTYYFAATSYDTSKNESIYSNEINRFIPIPGSPSFTISVSAGGNGSILPAGGTTVPGGANLTFTITPNKGYNVANVIVDGASMGAITTYTFTNISANHTISASFTLKLYSDVYSISAYKSGSGTITPAGVTTVSKGGNQTYAITANPGYYVSAVVVDGINRGAITNYTFSNITGNHTIMAYFQIVTYSITANAGDRRQHLSFRKCYPCKWLQPNFHNHSGFWLPYRRCAG